MNRGLPLLALLLAFPPAAAPAENFTGYLQNLTIAPGHSLENVVCFACSTRIEGTRGLP